MHMAAAAGSDFDAEKSALLRKLGKLPTIRHVLIVDDDEQDARHISAVLHLLLGRDVEIASFRTIAAALQRLREQSPDLIVLDDHLPPLDRAESSMRSFRRFGCEAPVIVVSGILTRMRRIELAQLQVLYIMDKDDVNTFTFAEALGRLVPGSGT